MTDLPPRTFEQLQALIHNSKFGSIVEVTPEEIDILKLNRPIKKRMDVFQELVAVLEPERDNRERLLRAAFAFYGFKP